MNHGDQFLDPTFLILTISHILDHSKAVLSVLLQTEFTLGVLKYYYLANCIVVVSCM